MKYRIKVENETFEVEIQDICARPVIALVDGEPFQVWPEAEASYTRLEERLASEAAQRPVSAPAGAVVSRPAAPAPAPAITAPAAGVPANLKVIRSPLPGVITEVSVKPGEDVCVGQQLCILEAMKMKNAIRAGRSGRIKSVQVTLGQHVKHQDSLMEYED